MVMFLINNLETYFVSMGLLLAVLIWIVYFSPSVSQAGNEDTESYNSQELETMRLYRLVYSFIVYKLESVGLLIFLFKPKYLYSFLPFSWRARYIIGYTLDDVATEVVTLLQSKLDLEFIITKAVNVHFLEILNTIMILIVAYVSALVRYESASDDDKLNFGNSIDSYDFFIVLWFWFVATSLIMLSYTMVSFINYIKLRRRQKYKHFSKMEDWLCDLCEEEFNELDLEANEAGMNGFEDAAKFLVMDPRINKYAIKDMGYYCPMEDVVPYDIRGRNHIYPQESYCL